MPLDNSSQETDELYASALAELDSANRSPGLWARSLAECAGDIERTRASYIRMRVQRLLQQREQDEAQARAESAAAAERSKLDSLRWKSRVFRDLEPPSNVALAATLFVGGTIVACVVSFCWLAYLVLASRSTDGQEGLLYEAFALAIFLMLIAKLASKLREGKNWARWITAVLLSYALLHALVAFGLGLFGVVVDGGAELGGWVALFVVWSAVQVVTGAWAGYTLFLLFSSGVGAYFAQEVDPETD